MREAIDFSCKHDILIHHKDGTFTPMDEPYYEVTKINETTWQIMSSGDYHYLLEGDEEAISIDTGYGAGNLREFLELLVHKPVRWCVNTHHHFDHSANNCYFDLVYMAEESVPLAAVPYKSFEGIDFPRDYQVQVVGDNDVIPLKGRELEIFKIGDHTEGGIAILDRKERMLFVGDEIMPGNKMISATVEKLRKDMGKLVAHRSEFDYLYGGSGKLPVEMVETFYEAAGLIMDGAPTETEMPRERPGGGPGGPGGPGGHKYVIPGAPEGVKVYDCQHPHPEDVGGGGKGPREKGPMKVFAYKDCRFMFNADRVFEK